MLIDQGLPAQGLMLFLDGVLNCALIDLTGKLKPEGACRMEPPISFERGRESRREGCEWAIAGGLGCGREGDERALREGWGVAVKVIERAIAGGLGCGREGCEWACIGGSMPEAQRRRGMITY